MAVKKLVSVGPDIPEGFEDFHKGIEKAAAKYLTMQGAVQK